MTFIKSSLIFKTCGFHSINGLFLLALSVLTAYGQNKPPTPAPGAEVAAYTIPLNRVVPNINEPPPMRPAPSLIVRKFIAAETEFREVATKFSFRRDVLLQTIGANGEVTGEYLRNSIFVLDDHGRRFERVLYHPRPSIKALKITKEDIQDLAGSQLFGPEAADLSAYSFTYEGQDNVNGRLAYLIRATPKQQPDPRKMRERFFVGLIWVDHATYQILKVKGNTLPQGKQRFPAFETIRDLDVENLRFPSSTSADDVLHFPKFEVRYRITVRYYDFKKFSSRVTITEIR